MNAKLHKILTDLCWLTSEMEDGQRKDELTELCVELHTELKRLFDTRPISESFTQTLVNEN
jgi:hypothetical protein